MSLGPNSRHLKLLVIDIICGREIVILKPKRWTEEKTKLGSKLLSEKDQDLRSFLHWKRFIDFWVQFFDSNFKSNLLPAEIGKCQFVLIFFTGMAVMGTVLENINVSFILPYAECDLKLTIAEQGLLNTSFILMGGRLGDMTGSKLLENNCNMIFYVFSGVLISEIGFAVRLIFRLTDINI